VDFAEDGSLIETLEDLLALLSLDELKTLAKDYNCKGTTKDKLLTSLLKVGHSQIGLSRSGSLGLDRDGAGSKPTRKSNQMMSRIRSMTGTMIRLANEPVMLFHRLHLVFYRSSEYSEKSLTTLILARISKRNFPTYEVDRLSTIFSSRQALLDYEHALKLKFEVDAIMELSSNQTEAGLDRVIAIFHQVYEDWQVLVMCEQDQEMQIKIESTDDPLHDRRARYYARRFTAGWVWTRLLFKAAVVFAKRHEYSREHEVWTALLSQKIFRVGRRGEWYDRKALIEQHYNPLALGPTAEVGVRKSKRLALETCVAGLQDVDTHQIYHHALQNRIVRLERDLNTVKRQQHDFSHILIRKPAKRQVIGMRLDDPETGKHSVWRGKDGGEVSVEQLSLEFYETLGWRGFHSENSIVTTLFGLLFWDILFLPIPGVFQTAFQTAPLDLATDAFYPSRASALNLRLAAIENGKAAELLQATDTIHRNRETWCVGVNWNYALQDLLEIASCIGPRPLAQLCRLFAEEYGHRVGGIGDLCMWNPDTRKCLFVEVKGPGDRLSETQIAWLDQMALAGVDVELCLVSEVQPTDGEHANRKRHAVKAKGKTAQSSRKVIGARQV
ncbi:VRR-NUC domain-domain-containing protein, partial [Protomyces lactucae-debilis]